MTGAASVRRLDARYLVVSVYIVSFYLVWIWQVNANVIMGEGFAVMGGRATLARGCVSNREGWRVQRRLYWHTVVAL